MADSVRRTDSYLTLSFVVQVLTGIFVAGAGWILQHTYVTINTELRELNRQVSEIRNDVNYLGWKVGAEPEPPGVRYLPRKPAAPTHPKEATP